MPLRSHASASATQCCQVTSSWPSIIRQTRMDDRMPPMAEYEISTDRDRLDVDTIHRFLSTEAYWSPGVAREVVERSIENSVCFGVYDGDEQVGFARVVTDGATFGWLADVFVVSAHRG